MEKFNGKYHKNDQIVRPTKTDCFFPGVSQLQLFRIDVWETFSADQLWTRNDTALFITQNLSTALIWLWEALKIKIF